ncbi:MAG: VanW family protein [Rubrobacteraceae bacterium]
MSIKNPKEKSGFEGQGSAGQRSFARNQRLMARKRRRYRLAGVLFLVCVFIGGLIAADYWTTSGEIYRGVHVGNLDLSGKTIPQARVAVRERVTRPLEKIELRGPDGKFTRSAGEMGVNFDVAGTVDKAYGVGREGSIVKRLVDRARAAYGIITLSPGVDYREKVARAEVQKISARLDHKPRNGEVKIDGSRILVNRSREGYKTNIGATMGNLDAAVRKMNGDARIVGKVTKPEVSTATAEKAAAKARRAMSSPLVLTAKGRRWTLSPSQLGGAMEVTRKGGDINVGLSRDLLGRSLAGVFGTLTAEPVEASYRVQGSGASVIPGKSGQSVQKDKLLGEIQNGIFSGRHEYSVPVKTLKPRLTTAEAEQLKPTQVIGEYKTNYMTYDDSPGRVTNLETASNAISGTLLAPGEVFSFNAIAAPLKYAKTKVILNGRVSLADGGGLCQVSSNLYMAANYAGLTVLERHPHYAELPYIQPGFDATVWFGSLDMQFQNTSGSYLLLREWVNTSNGNVTAQIWGRPTGKDVQMSSKKVATTKDSEGNPVTKWVTYKKVTENGKVLSDGVLHTDTYKYLKP